MMCIQQRLRWLLLPLVLLLAGCETVTDSAARGAGAQPDATVVSGPSAPAPNWVRATGYAPISLQPGATPQHKVLMAMRASKLRAYQELAAMVHGQYLFGTTTVQDMVLQSDQFKTAVAGIVRGARVVKSYPVQEDTYATILEVDLNPLQQAWINSDKR